MGGAAGHNLSPGREARSPAARRDARPASDRRPHARTPLPDGEPAFASPGLDRRPAAPRGHRGQRAEPPPPGQGRAPARGRAEGPRDRPRRRPAPRAAELPRGRRRVPQARTVGPGGPGLRGLHPVLARVPEQPGPGPAGRRGRRLLAARPDPRRGAADGRLPARDARPADRGEAVADPAQRRERPHVPVRQPGRPVRQGPGPPAPGRLAAAVPGAGRRLGRPPPGLLAGRPGAVRLALSEARLGGDPQRDRRPGDPAGPDARGPLDPHPGPLVVRPEPRRAGLVPRPGPAAPRPEAPRRRRRVGCGRDDQGARRRGRLPVRRHADRPGPALRRGVGRRRPGAGGERDARQDPGGARLPEGRSSPRPRGSRACRSAPTRG